MEFSEMLRGYLKEHNMTMAELSRSTGIERFALSRYINGKRIPSKPETAKIIADALQLNYNEKKKFFEAFEKAIYVDSMVNIYNYMKSLFSSLSHIYGSADRVDAKISADSGTADMTVDSGFHKISSKYDIISCVFRMFEGAARSKDTSLSHIQILVSHRSVCEEIQKIILPVFRGTSVNIQQVVCLEGNVNKCYMNLEILEDILPIGFGVENYRVYYYYGSEFEHNEKFSILPNLIAVNDTVLLLDGDMESGMITSSDEAVAYCRSRFDAVLAKCSPLLNKCDYISGYLGALYPSDSKTSSQKNIYVICEYPCMSYAATGELLDECLKDDLPGKREFIEQYTSVHGYFEDGKFINPSGEEQYIIDIVTKSGFLYQLREGVCMELPSEWYNPASLDVMQGFLKRMILLVKSGFMEYRFLKTDLGLPQNMQFFCSDKTKEVNFVDTGAFAFNQMNLQENSVFNAYHLFVEYLEAKEMIMTKEESLAFMEDTYRQIDSELKGNSAHTSK